MTLVYIVIILASGAVLLFFNQNLFASISADERGCKDSVNLAFKGSVRCLPDPLPFEFHCKTELAKIDADNKKEVMDQIAEQLYTCMWYVSRGEGLDKVECAGYLDRTYCFDCSVLEFGDKARRLRSISIQELNDHMMDMDAPYPFKGTYWDYLFDADAYFSLDRRDDFNHVEMRDQVEDFYKEGKIDLTKDYVVSYGLYLEQQLLPGPALVHFVLLSEEGGDLHTRLLSRCEDVSVS